ncbi:hypothetical protein JMUB6875_63030 [Nocardia sp. JMUB6875]|uniref:nuclear transport factor 2 family protein n=1 Tax=Nocardia sp. JMUB6875 TaxID=3158170 RepID=UPI0032E6F91F
MATGKAIEIARDYFAAWTSKNVDKATEYLTENVEIIAPNGTFTGHQGYHAYMDGFVTMLTGVSGLTVYGDDTTALSWFDTHLHPVPTLTGAERITLTDGKISRLEVVFDQTPLAG